MLRPGGHLLTTVDKHCSHGREGSGADDRRRVLAVAGQAGLTMVGEASFAGRSQWGSATDGDPVFRLVALSRD